MTNKRVSPRNRTLLAAKVVFNNRSSVLDAKVRNLSATGAKLELDNPFAVPDQFELEIPTREAHFFAEVRWRDAKTVGVEFVNHGQPGVLES